MREIQARKREFSRRVCRRRKGYARSISATSTRAEKKGRREGTVSVIESPEKASKAMNHIPSAIKTHSKNGKHLNPGLLQGYLKRKRQGAI